MNCLKRTVVCILTTAEGKVIGIGRNQCDPPQKMNEAWMSRRECARMNIVATEEGYDGKGCNSVHAEINALKEAAASGEKPRAAHLFGHDFCCEDCRKALHAAGVEVFFIGQGTSSSAVNYFLNPKTN